MAITSAPTTKLQVDGQLLRQLVRAGLHCLEQNRDFVNALNVFPVPDGDTGTNMLLTMRSAWKHIDESSETHVGNMAALVARGALMGARGNSGVILSQFWRGFAKVIKDRESFDAHWFAQGLQGSSDTAYKGVMKPVEGTILTIIRESAEKATQSAAQTNDFLTVLKSVLDHSRVALANTPNQLPVLKQANVVDSGGQGLVYLFEGMVRWLTGDLTAADFNVDTKGDNHTNGHPAPAQALARPEDGQVENPYDVQFILLGKNLNVDRIRHEIDAMGDSTVVVGDDTTIKVHVHVKDPGVPLSYGIRHGAITDVVVENMQEQMEEIISNSTPSATNGLQPHAPTNIHLEPGQIGVVTMASGPGLREVFASLGATIIIEGGQTNNPSTEEIFAAIQDVPSDKVIILPNNKNIFLAAEAARDLSPKDVVIVPTRSIPQGSSAMISYNAEGDLATVAAAMRAAADDVATGEITTAVRTVTLDGVAVEEGQLIGIVNGKLCASGSDLAPVLDQTLTTMQLNECEIVTIYYGVEVSAETAQHTATHIEQAYPDIETELIDGGQAHYDYILSAE